MADINVTVTTPSTITATATDPNTVAVAVSAASTVTVTASVGASGTVTSIATTAPITGGTITGSGTIGISAATTAAAGSMSASDKTKLDGIEAGAEVNNISDVNATDLTDSGITSLHKHNLSLGSEEIANGEFTSDASNWTLGAGWAWVGEAQVQHTAGNTGTLSQSGELVDGDIYLAMVTIAGTVGTVQVTFGAGVEFTLSPTYGFGTTIGLSGVWSTGLGYKLSFLPSSNFDGYISVVSMKKQAFIQDANRDALYYVRKDGVWEAVSIHARQHAITSTSDHTSTATSGQILKADANGLPVNATNTDAQVSAAVTASHAAVTVADSASIDMTLTGQQVSAAAIFGTSAGVVAEGNHTHYSYYTLQWSQAGGWSVLANTTYYLGGKLVQDGNAARARLYFPVAGTIISADFCSYVGTTLASAETSSAWVRINNTTDNLISNAIQQDAIWERFVNSSLSIAVSAGDYFEIKWTTPAWGTTPTNTRQYGIITVRV